MVGLLLSFPSGFQTKSIITFLATRGLLDDCQEERLLSWFSNSTAHFFVGITNCTHIHSYYLIPLTITGDFFFFLFGSRRWYEVKWQKNCLFCLQTGSRNVKILFDIMYQCLLLTVSENYIYKVINLVYYLSLLTSTSNLKIHYYSALRFSVKLFLAEHFLVEWLVIMHQCISIVVSTSLRCWNP